MLLGFVIAAPVGPIGLLCIRRSLQLGSLAGVTSGFGTAAADALYAAIAAFGLTAIASIIEDWQIAIRIGGGIFLLLIAAKIYFSSNTQEIVIASRNAVSNFISTFLLTLTSPATILGFTAFFAGLGWTSESGTEDACLLVAGVFIGSMMWWVTLSACVSKMRPASLLQNMRQINHIAAFLLGTFGLWAIGSVLIRL